MSDWRKGSSHSEHAIVLSEQLHLSVQRKFHVLNRVEWLLEFQNGHSSWGWSDFWGSKWTLLIRVGQFFRIWNYSTVCGSFKMYTPYVESNCYLSSCLNSCINAFVSGLGIQSFQKNAMILRSFPFFIKEQNVFYVLLRSL